MSVSANTLGVNMDESTDKQLFSLGSTQPVKGGNAVYVRASANITANNNSVSVNANTFAATGAGGNFSGPPIAVPSGNYFWARKAL